MYLIMLSRFYRAIDHRDQESIKKLLNDKHPNALINTALLHAVEKDNAEIVKLLLDAGADTNVSTTVRGWTSLHIAGSNGNEDITKLLLDYGANPYVKDKNSTSVIRKVEAGYIQSLQNFRIGKRWNNNYDKYLNIRTMILSNMHKRETLRLCYSLMLLTYIEDCVWNNIPSELVYNIATTASYEVLNCESVPSNIYY